MFLQAYIQNFAENGQVVTDKTSSVSCVNDLGPRSRNDIDLQYSHIFIKIISFRSQAAIVSSRKAVVTKFGLVVKYVKINSMSSFEQTMMGRSPLCYIPSFVEIGLLVPEKKIFEGFLPYMGMAAILVM